MSGWIRVDRKIWDDDSFKREPMSEREAFIWMVANAAWADTTHRVGGEAIAVQRGSFITTLRELQSAFMWRSDARVRGFLKRLENERTIERTTVGPTNAPKTHVTICNYARFQDSQQPTNARGTHGERTENALNKQYNNKQDTNGDFEAFWARVPRKVGKGQARKAFNAALKKADVSTILDGMERYARSVKGKDSRFIAHPATWLNGERWTDEVDENVLTFRQKPQSEWTAQDRTKAALAWL